MKRLDAPLCVFNFGIKIVLDSLQELTSVALFLVVFPLFIPGHLDGFELAFVRFGRIVAEAFKLGDPFEEIGEADFEWILLGELIVKGEGDVFGLVPGENGHWSYSN